MLTDYRAKDGNLDGFLASFYDVTDFRQLVNGKVCQYCGQVTGQPCDISLWVYTARDDKTNTEAVNFDEFAERYTEYHSSRNVNEDEINTAWYIKNSMMHTGYPDPESRYHNHGPSNPDEARIRYRDAFTDNGYLFYEWVYVVQPQTNELHVMTSIETPLTITIDPTDETPGRKEPFYVPIVVTTVNLDEPEPNWKHLEELAVTIREQREAEYKANPNHPDLVQLRKMVPGAEVPTEAKPRP